MITKNTSIADYLGEFCLYNKGILTKKEQTTNSLYQSSLKFCTNLGLPINIANNYLVDFSVKNPTSIKMYKSLDKLLENTSDGEGKATVMRFGKFLTMTEQFSEARIKKYVEVFNSLIGNFNYYELTVDYPDGWVDVYENGVSFVSCMTYDRESRTLYADLFGDNHPIRAYCHPDNTIRLAYLANKEWSPDVANFRVTARAIINCADTSVKTYPAVYGNEALHTILDNAGFEQRKDALMGQYLIKKPYDDSYIVPFVDCCHNLLEDCTDRWKISDTGNYGAFSSKGLAVVKYACLTCGCEQFENTLYYGPDNAYCSSCIDKHCIYVHIDKYTVDYVRLEDEYYKYGNDYYTPEALKDLDLILVEGKVYPTSLLVYTANGYVLIDECTKLDIPFNGHDYANTYDTIYAWNSEGNELAIHEDTDLNAHSLFATRKAYLESIKIGETRNE